ncbi:hypothetical protein GCM10009564_48340 [Streptomyces thermogriseus]|uniref:Uncharacterized protein n=1 Tax=Streptomyces thermogriseus TaxID=75292 RepID=A0ABP4DN75_9ACTN
MASAAARHGRSRRSRTPAGSAGGACAGAGEEAEAAEGAVLLPGLSGSQDFPDSQAGRTTWWTDDPPPWGIGSSQTQEPGLGAWITLPSPA